MDQWMDDLSYIGADGDLSHLKGMKKRHFSLLSLPPLLLLRVNSSRPLRLFGLDTEKSAG